jgi:CDP-diacylglycerol--glycerol-3-phosphate 3-phosphatidyltransferase
MTPNQITLFRVFLAFLAVGLFTAGRSGSVAGVIATFFGQSSLLWTSLAALGLIVTAIALDAVDGYIARRRHLATPLGAQLDILGDRVIENLFFTYFAVCGLVSVWVPVIFFVRGTATDFIRGLAAAEGREGFGRNSMMETRWGRALVASRSSRAAYAALKCVCFCYLGAQLAISTGTAALFGPFDVRDSAGEIVILGELLVVLTVSFCLVRGLPVLWEGRHYLRRLGASMGAPAGVSTLRSAAVDPGQALRPAASGQAR